MFRSGDILGLAFGERFILCAEVASRATGSDGLTGGSSVRKVARFDYPDGASLDRPDALGQALAVFLRGQGFSSSRVVAGVPAKWLIASERDVPPSDDAAMRAMLRLTAERAGAAEGGEMIFDYLPTAAVNRTTGGKVLIVGILRKQLERVRSTLDAAGLTIAAITSTSLAMAAIAAGESTHANDSVLVLDRTGGEVIWRRNGAATMFRHVGLPTAAAVNGESPVVINALGAELRRAVALSPMSALANGKTSSGSSSNVPNGDGLIVWDLLGLSKPQMEELSQRVGKPMIATTPGATNNGMAEYGPAIALAIAEARKNVLIDFAHSRLEPVPQRGIPQRTAMLIMLGAIALIALLSLAWNLHEQRSELAALQQNLSEQGPDIKAAEATVARFDYARGFFETRTPVLECLRDITQSFRDDEPIWVTSFAVRENGVCQIGGKSTEQRNVLSVRDRLSKSPRFKDVKLLDMRESGGKTREASFSISFNYIAEAAPSH